MEKRYKTRNQFSSSVFQKILAISPFNHEKSKTGEDKAAAETHQTSLLESTLPPELLLLIVNKLDIVDQVCLQSTNHFFHHFIKLDADHQALLLLLNSSKCRKWAIYCRLEKDLDYLPKKLVCAFCKTTRKQICFRDHKEVRLFDLGKFSLRLKYGGGNDKELQIFNFGGFSLRFRHNFGFERGGGGRGARTMLYAPPSVRFCTAHRKLLFSGGPDALPEKSTMRFQTDTVPWPRWISAQVLRCWHCGLIVPEGDLRTTGCLHCLCDVCPRMIWQHYFRAGPCSPSGGQYKYDLYRKNVWLPGGKHRGKRYVVEVGNGEPVPIVEPVLRSSGSYAI